MRLKTKISLALAFLFSAILGITILSWYYIEDVSKDAENILKDNYESIEFTKRIIEACDSIGIDRASAMMSIENNLKLQESNQTEIGEQELTSNLRRSFVAMRDHADPADLVLIRGYALQLQTLNMEAIKAKNIVTTKTGDKASAYILMIAGIVGIVAFTFILNFPGYLANPIEQLTSGIQSIAKKNYEERLHFDRSDEFGELAEAFNLMAEKLDEYEHSNLARLLFEKKRIETIINTMTDPVIGLDEKKKIIFVNQQALEMLGLKQEQLTGRYAPDVALENDLLRNLIRPSIERTDAEMVKIVVDGRENYFTKETISINYIPTGENENVAVGSVILLKNITPYKERDLAKTNFIATISHELKTPIASLQLGVKLLYDDRIGKLNEEQLNIIRTLNDETVRLSRITNELLDLSQAETGNIKLNIQKVEATDIIRYALESVKFHAERKKVILESVVASGLPSVKADRDKTTWVLVNFLTNAIRYSPENGTVTLTCKQQGNNLIFSVTDAGPGIEKKYMSRLFEKYFQVPGSLSGTGLGLAISKEFIEAQGGRIGVESEIGMGSTFTFELFNAA